MEGFVFMVIPIQQDAEITGVILVLQDAWFMVFFLLFRWCFWK